MPSKTRPILAALAGAVLVAAAAGAAETLTAEQIVAKNVEARGGRDAFEAIRSARLTGKLTMGEQGATPFTLWLKRPSKMRFELDLEGVTEVLAFDGESGWGISPLQGRPTPQPLPAEQLGQLRDMADFDGPLLDYQAKGHEVELVGMRAVEGSEAYELRLTKKGGDVVGILVDAETFLELEQEMTVVGPEGEARVEVAIGDYKRVGGILYPHTLRQSVEGIPVTQTISIETVEPNVEVGDDRFVMPPRSGG